MSYKTYKKDILLHRGRNRKARPKTFSTEDAAHAYAKEQGIATYELKNLNFAKKENKIKIVVK